ncbi:MAG: DUF5668 domain-containing protein, partial [Anaerolineales bacterium]|nr:DUF5668 domain-containing protein [Anaerolineales bacterium]
MSEFKNKSGLFWPFVLISVGIVILFQNLGLLDSNLWDILVDLWPLLLIALGLNDLIRNRVIVSPVLTIGLGAAFLANKFGLLDWGSWTSLLNLWPVLIIAIGLEIFLGRKKVWLSALGVGFSLSILAIGLWFSGGVNEVAPIVRGTPLPGKQIIQPLEGATSARIHIASSVGALHIAALSNADADALISGEVTPARNETIDQVFELDGAEAYYRLQSNLAPNTNFRVSDYERTRLNWDLALTREIPLALDISLGVGESALDLSELTVTELDLNLGVGQTRVTLPNGEYTATIEG